MSEMTNATVHPVAGKEVIFRELSVAAIRKLITKEQSGDGLGDGLFESIRLCDIPDFTNLSDDEVESLLPSQIKLVIKHCEAQNPDFFGWLARLSSFRASL